MRRDRLLVFGVTILLLGAGGIFLARADAPIGSPFEAPPYLPAAEPPPHVIMDHGEKDHHHHAHLEEHKGQGHTPAGRGDHHHHHHAHPHPPDPHHHHPH